jgi:predicted ATPase
MNKDNKNVNVDNTDKKLHISDVRQRLINRIVELKEQRKNFYGEIEKNKNSPIRMSISSETRNFYEYTCDKLIKELEDILNVDSEKVDIIKLLNEYSSSLSLDSGGVLIGLIEIRIIDNKIIYDFKIKYGDRKSVV